MLGGGDNSIRTINPRDAPEPVAAIRLAALKTVAAGQRPAALSAHLMAFTSQGEAHYNAGQHQQVVQVLGLLLTSAGQYQKVTGYDRGLYFLGLGNYQLDRAAEKAGTKPDEKATLASLRALAAPARNTPPVAASWLQRWPPEAAACPRSLERKEERRRRKKSGKETQNM